MKKFLVLFAIFTVLMFVVSCGGSKKTEDDSDTGETVTDEDTVDTEPTGDTEPADDTDTTGDTDTDKPDDDPGKEDPCVPNPCIGVEHSTGVCIHVDDFYDCECEKNYDWTGAESLFPCSDLCEIYPCEGVEGSTGECTYDESGKRRICGCKEHFNVAFDEENGMYYCAGEKRTENCEGLPENAEWNGVTKITQTWNGYDNDFYPPTKGVYAEEPCEEYCCFKCQEGFYWNETISQCVKPCEPNLCSEMAHSDGTCTKTGDTTFICGCETGYHWDTWSEECADVCDPNPCIGVPKSDEVCSVNGTTFTCGCEAGYFWTTAGCEIDSCYNVNCGAVDHSDGTCQRVGSSTYSCGCEQGYSWDNISPQCLPSQCVPNRCIGLPNSDEVCSVSGTTYACGCEAGYFWDPTDGCQPDSCYNVSCGAHSDGICQRIDSSTYSCGCEPGYLWEPTGCQADPCYNVNCGDHSDGICQRIGSSTYSCGCEEGYYWDAASHRCNVVEPTEEEKCIAAGGTWIPSSSTCIKTVTCADKPSHAEWNGNSSYTMTYANDAWSGAVNTVYSEEAGTCHFKCVNNYFWKRSQCVTPCNCSRISHSTGVCTATDVYTYSCSCSEGYYWTDSACKLPECSQTSGTPCQDSSGLIWSKRAPTYMIDWQGALDYCNSLHEADFSSGWRLPTITELRTLVQNCPSTEMSGDCGIRDDSSVVCLTGGNVCDANCTYCYPGYCKISDSDMLWSSSIRTDNAGEAWTLDCGVTGIVSWEIGLEQRSVRCVRGQYYH